MFKDFFPVTETYDLNQKALVVCDEINYMAKSHSEQMAILSNKRAWGLVLCQAGMELVAPGMIGKGGRRICTGKCVRRKMLLWLSFKLGRCLRQTNGLM